MTNQGGFMNCYKICLTKSLSLVHHWSYKRAESTELPDPSYSDNVRGDRNHQKHEVPQIQEMVQMQTLALFI